MKGDKSFFSLSPVSENINPQDCQDQGENVDYVAHPISYIGLEKIEVCVYIFLFLSLMKYHKIRLFYDIVIFIDISV